MKTIDPKKQAIGSRIAEAREKLGLTQEELAHKVGVSKAAVWQWEKGQTGPSNDALPRLPDILKVRWEWLTLGKLPRDEPHTGWMSDIEQQPSPAVLSQARNQKLKEIGSRISQARGRKHMSLAALAEKLDVAKATILAWEQGTAMAEMAKFDAIAETLEVTRQWLYTGNEDDKAAMAQDVLELEILKAARLLTRKQQVASLNDMYGLIDGNATAKKALEPN